MTYSIDFRHRVLKIKAEEGLSYSATSKRFGVSVNSILLWTKRIEAKKSRDKPWTKIKVEDLKADIRLYSDAYYYERAKRFGVSVTGIYRAMKRLGISYKKKSQSSQGESRRTAYFPTEDRVL